MSNNSLKYHLVVGDQNADALLNALSGPRESTSSSSPSISSSSTVSIPGDQTLLHIAVSEGQVQKIKEFMDRLNADQIRELLLQKDNNDDLPIHVAIKTGQNDIVLEFINNEKTNGCTDDQLEGTDKDGNTALHLALDNLDKKLSKRLFDKCKNTIYVLNKKNMCPLYQAIKAGFSELANDMMNDGQSDSEVATNALEVAERALTEGKSIFHAAITANNIEILAKLKTEPYSKFINSTDEKDRTLLSYAVETGSLKAVKHLLTDHPELAYIEDKNYKKSYPILTACSKGNMKIVKAFYKHQLRRKVCDKDNRSILHYAAMGGQDGVVEYLVKKEGTLINMKDNDGRTPLHLAAMEGYPKVVYRLAMDDRTQVKLRDNEGSTALDLVERSEGVPSLNKRLTRIALMYAKVPRTPETVENELPTLLDMENQCNTKPKQYKDRLEGILLVSILVATAAFTATFQIPGGYDSSTTDDQQGLATFAKKHVFQLFILSNTLAMYSSIFSTVVLIWAHLNDMKLMSLSGAISLISLGFSLTMMSIAVMSGSFIVLHNRCNWLSITVLVLGVFLTLIILLVFIPLCSPTSSKINCIKRMFLAIFLRLMLWVLG